MFKALGVHIFAGGFTRGVLDAGFAVHGQLETSKFGLATSELNNPSVPVATPKEQWEDFLRELGEDSIDMVYANPPCAPWSAAGMSKNENRGYAAQSYKKDPRVKCVEDVYEVISRMQPRVAVWESVARAATAGLEFLNSLAERMAPQGYQTTLVLADMADTGLPQHRSRLFTVLHKIAFTPAVPAAQHVTVREALEGVTYDPEVDIQVMSPRHLEILRKTAPGRKLFQTYNDMHNTTYQKGVVASGRPPFLYRKLEWDKPSYTLTGGPHLFHPEEERMLSVQEMAALCGYPKDYKFVGRLGDRYRQLAQCVTPTAGRWIAMELKRALARDQRLAIVAPTPRVFDYRPGKLKIDI